MESQQESLLTHSYPLSSAGSQQQQMHLRQSGGAALPSKDSSASSSASLFNGLPTASSTPLLRPPSSSELLLVEDAHHNNNDMDQDTEETIKQLMAAVGLESSSSSTLTDQSMSTNFNDSERRRVGDTEAQYRVCKRRRSSVEEKRFDNYQSGKDEDNSCEPPKTRQAVASILDGDFPVVVSNRMSRRSRQSESTQKCGATDSGKKDEKRDEQQSSKAMTTDDEGSEGVVSDDHVDDPSTDPDYLPSVRQTRRGRSCSINSGSSQMMQQASATARSQRRNRGSLMGDSNSSEMLEMGGNSSQQATGNADAA